MADETHLPGGVVHDLPRDLEEALKLHTDALATWEDITPLARNEWICWVDSAKKSETRRKRIDWGCSSAGQIKALATVTAPTIGTVPVRFAPSECR